MPELPEVQTIVNDLNKKVRGLKITSVWTDPPPFPMVEGRTGWKKDIKEFTKQLKGRKILKARRRAKYILIDLSDGKTLIIHLKISGHLLYKKNLDDRFIRLFFYLNNGKQLGLSDLRRFAKMLLIDTDKINKLKEIEELGPEPLDKRFTFNKFKEVLHNKKGKIKQVLMNQNIIAGIGNIYSDEILFEAKTRPLKSIPELSEDGLKRIYQAMKKILQRAIVLGERYQEVQKVYQRTGQKCYRCKGVIKRIKIGGRSAHFCPACQK